jgi:hypothetical protein
MIVLAAQGNCLLSLVERPILTASPVCAMVKSLLRPQGAATRTESTSGGPGLGEDHEAEHFRAPLESKQEGA